MTSQACLSSEDSSNRFPSPSPPTASHSASSPGQDPPPPGVGQERGEVEGQSCGWTMALYGTGLVISRLLCLSEPSCLLCQSLGSPHPWPLGPRACLEAGRPW